MSDHEEPELAEKITRICRLADESFEKPSGGGSARHWVREHFLPILNQEGYVIVKKEERKALTEDELFAGYGKQIDRNHAALAKHTEQLDIAMRALALQASYVTVLQRVLVRIAAELVKLDAGDAIAQAMQDGALQIERETKKLASQGYLDVLAEMLGRFDTMRQDLAGVSKPKNPHEFDEQECCIRCTAFRDEAPPECPDRPKVREGIPGRL